MKKSITVKRFTVGSSFKIVLIGVSISMIAFAILMGVFALFGAQTVHWGQQPITGVAGLLASPFIGVFLAVIFSFFGWLGFMFSFWLFSRFGSMTIEYITDEPPPGASPE
jgi:ABC-type polysaccharide/polyol phosphate export permease